MKGTENGDKSFCSKNFEMKGFLLYDRETMGINGRTRLQSCLGGKKSGIAPRELFPVLRYPRGAINKPFLEDWKMWKGTEFEAKRNPIKNLLKAHVSFFGDSNIKDPSERTIRKGTKPQAKLQRYGTWSDCTSSPWMIHRNRDTYTIDTLLLVVGNETSCFPLS